MDDAVIYSSNQDGVKLMLRAADESVQSLGHALSVPFCVIPGVRASLLQYLQQDHFSQAGCSVFSFFDLLYVELSITPSIEFL